MNAIDILLQDHAEIKKVLKSITESKNTALKSRKTLMTKLSDLIKVHTTLEEKLVYPLTLKNRSLEKLTREAYEEHNAVDMLLKKALKVEVNDPSWLAKFKVIKENLEHHIDKEEEQKMFPALKKILPKQDLEEIGDKMLILKKNLITKSKKKKEKVQHKKEVN
ncbi:MAG TPA: hemerythrin domain-containing protein [Gammaproteobacteria bacterium]|nr:hemerythrin domain-containing protein [Gammaproteobacteria bacterium]